jgi:hypothetical protein
MKKKSFVTLLASVKFKAEHLPVFFFFDETHFSSKKRKNGTKKSKLYFV